MLNVTNETVWIGKVPAALGTDHCGYGLDRMLCAFVVSWQLTTPDIIRSHRRSMPWATVFSPHLIIPQHYSNWGLWNMHFPIRRSPPPLPTTPNLRKLLHCLKEGEGQANTCWELRYLTEVSDPPFVTFSEVFSNHFWQVLKWTLTIKFSSTPHWVKHHISEAIFCLWPHNFLCQKTFFISEHSGVLEKCQVWWRYGAQYVFKA